MERLFAGYHAQDPSRINETISRYSYLLSDTASPILANFKDLLDYTDGRDMPPLEEFQNGGDANEEIDQLLKKHVNQGQRMNKLCD